MKALWITRQCPEPANSGEFLYSRGLILSLAEAGMELSVLCAERDQAPPERRGIRWVLSPMRATSRVWSLISGLPSDSRRMASAVARASLQQELKSTSWDVVFVDQAAMGWCLPDLAEARRNSEGMKIVYVSHNCEAIIRPEIARTGHGNILLRWLMRYDAWKYARLERALVREADLVTCITDQDARQFQLQNDKAELLVLLPGFTGERPAWHMMDTAVPRRVVMSGSFEWIAKRINLERFLRVADPVFVQSKIELQIVGKADPAFARRMRETFPSCRFDCNVPSVEPFLTGARMGLIIEEVGGGFKLKALEYVFHSLPIAALRGATAGLPLKAGPEMLCRSNVQDLVATIADSIDELDTLREMSRKAYARCRVDFDWEDRGRCFLEKLHEMEAAAEPGLRDAELDPHQARGILAGLNPPLEQATGTLRGGRNP